MFELQIKLGFSAAHHLVGYPGNCARQHGHNWTLQIFARSEELNSIGLAMDFEDLKKAADEIISRWDHYDLNEVEDFKNVPASAENIARVAYKKLSSVINSPKTRIDRVTVWENDSCSATYWE